MGTILTFYLLRSFASACWEEDEAAASDVTVSHRRADTGNRNLRDRAHEPKYTMERTELLSTSRRIIVGGNRSQLLHYYPRKCSWARLNRHRDCHRRGFMRVEVEHGWNRRRGYGTRGRGFMRKVRRPG